MRRSPMQVALEREVVPHTALLVACDAKGKPAELGSGTLLAVGSRRFVVSCAHVGRSLAKHPGASAMLFADYTNPSLLREPQRLKEASFLFPLDGREAVLDVCILELPRGRLSIADDARFLDVSRVSLEIDASDVFVFMGLPGQHTQSRKHTAGVEIVGVPLVYRTSMYRGRKRPVNHPYEPDNHLLLWEKREATRPVSGNVLAALEMHSVEPVPELYGMSGCGVWAYRADDLRKKRAFDFRLVAVEFATWHGEFIQCARIGCALRVIYEKYSDLPDPLGFYGGSGVVKLTERWR